MIITRKVALLALAFMAACAIALAGCGSSGASASADASSNASASENGSEQNSEKSQESGNSQSSQVSAQAKQAEKVPAIEVEGCHFVPEKLAICEGASSGDAGQDGFCMLVLRMEEDEVPVQVTPFGAICGFEVMLSKKVSGEQGVACPWLVRFEQLDKAKGSGTRATFYYKLTPGGREIGGREYYKDDGGKLPAELYYQKTDDENYGTYKIGKYSDQIPVEKGEGEWPAAATELTGLDENVKSVPIDGELVLLPDYYTQVHALNSWADELLRDCCQKLVDDGAMAAPAADAPNEYFTFDDASTDVDYLDPKVAKRLSGDLRVELGDVIFSSSSNGVYYKNPIDSLADYPLFYPVVYGDSLTNPTWSEPSDLSEEQIAEFADSIGGCRYVVTCMGPVSRVHEGFYDTPRADRKLMTTLVVVIDTQSREFVHIHKVGTDGPGLITEDPSGKMMTQEAVDYMFSLL